MDWSETNRNLEFVVLILTSNRWHVLHDVREGVLIVHLEVIVLCANSRGGRSQATGVDCITFCRTAASARSVRQRPVQAKPGEGVAGIAIT
ncbi:MAG: hypothetical protein R6V59_09215 [Dehalococcoidia bacterium]